jgi:hemolysin activation/secretion protein
VQYVRRIYEDWEALFRSDLQLSSRPLFQMEQISFGGLGSVRGYRSYLTVTDDGFLASAELRIPVGKLRLPYLADSDVAGTVQIVSFYDYARAWNVVANPVSAADLRRGRRTLVYRLGLPQVLLWQGAAPRKCGQLDRGPRHLLRLTSILF